MDAGEYPTMAGHSRLVRLLGKGPGSEVYLRQYAIKRPATPAHEHIQTL